MSSWTQRIVQEQIRQQLLQARPRISHTPLHSGRREPVTVHSGALPPALLRQVTAQARSLADRDGTLWFAAWAAAKTPIERAIRELERTVVHPPDTSVGGAEYWVQRLPGGSLGRDSIALHFDKDECEAARREELTHPSLGSILYLTSGGGPTLFFPSVASQTLSPEIDGGIAVFPRRNRFVTFCGNLLHGVAAEPWPVAEEERLTLLVNWWLQKKPEAPCCVEPPNEMLEAHAKPYTNERCGTARRLRPRRTSVDNLSKPLVLDLALPGLVGGGHFRLRTPWPRDKTLAQPGLVVEWSQMPVHA